ncbi:LytR/AlgR family response regulator transcription factor [Clostridium magnum]|uniref:Stage 0 sporulation protein A homolog n=1 Tax=Clostridium magnum DSM 2767 TaxID=1121326 RepID=A0A162RZE4_9CLOT|nr:response regulator [Clostridium magnum]KZL90584.1 cyclic di-GMP phosphodiesterase response regulator RpfG [Clostridium magnum DSM 2767]SHI05438.1 Response regulator receiver domain-containing protein [Clostridium magnum DSM 2767]
MAVGVIVDDNEKALNYSLSMIKDMGQFKEIYGFCYPEEAYSFIKQKGCDVLFVETEMKGMNCFVLINKLRKIYNNIFFIIVMGREEYAYEALQKDIMDYILKPLSPKRIRETLKRLRKYY